MHGLPPAGSCAASAAHHAGAVPLDLLTEEQDRIARRLAFLDSRIDAGQIEYDQAKAHLEDCRALAGDMHAIYMNIDDSLRRICNQAFFDRINVYELDDGADVVDADGRALRHAAEPLAPRRSADLRGQAACGRGRKAH